MDLSKAYACILHELFLAKLEFYGLDKTSLLLMLDELTNRNQRTKIGSALSSWYDISTGVPQGSILGALLLIIFINDLFFAITSSEVYNFADYNIPYNCNKILGNTFSNGILRAC